ncbi:GIY-YIG nuclease family protein [Oceanibaculum indicum]|nr:GIY-YIG nuclease family protein [Oceanibaculum indicum]
MGVLSGVVDGCREACGHAPPLDARVKPGHDKERSSDDAGGTMAYYVYILASGRNGTLYVGVTGNLPRRIYEHREELVPGFTKQYGVKRLVYAEAHEDVRIALQREKNLKHWSRAWKLALIEAGNPSWRDLF